MVDRWKDMWMEVGVDEWMGDRCIYDLMNAWWMGDRWVKELGRWMDGLNAGGWTGRMKDGWMGWLKRYWMNGWIDCWRVDGCKQTGVDG